MEIVPDDQKDEIRKSELGKGLIVEGGITWIKQGWVRTCGSKQEPREILSLSDAIEELGLEGWKKVNAMET